MSKRGAIKQLIQLYYHQLTIGCGDSNCINELCASNPLFSKLTENDAAAKAIALCKDRDNLCVSQRNKIAKTVDNEENVLSHDSVEVPSTSNGDSTSFENTNVSVAIASSCTDNSTILDKVTNTETVQLDATVEGCSKVPNDTTVNTKLKKITANKVLKSAEDLKKDKELQGHLRTLENIDEVLAENKDDFSFLKLAIWNVFSSLDAINIYAVPKEKVKSQLLQDEDKDIDEMEISDSGTAMVTNHTPMSIDSEVAIDLPSTSKQTDNSTITCPTVDMTAVRTLYQHCSKHQQLETVMFNAISYLIDDVKGRLIREPKLFDINLNMFVVLMENNCLHNPDAFEKTFPIFLKLLAKLPLAQQATLARHWSQYETNYLSNMVESIQQLITVRVVMEFGDDSMKDVQKDDIITSAAKSLNILFYASLLGGEVSHITSTAAVASKTDDKKTTKKDSEHEFMSLLGSDDNVEFGWDEPLGKLLKINILDSVKPKVAHIEFVNEALNDCIQTEQDYANYKLNQTGPSKFSFLHVPFLLNTVNKTACLFYDNRCRMTSERRRTFVSSFMQGALINPYLKIQVRRNHVIDDALVQLEMAAENSNNFKKQLFVEFDGEEGVDEGGVSKEFFQLVVEQIFNPDNGMFTYDDETRYFWFNSHSFESQVQYKLIGIVLGLAIYNSCILDVSFPPFIYKKLLGRKATFHDMEQSHPVVYRSLKSLLEHEGDVEEDMMVNFNAQYQDVFGGTVQHELKQGGDNIPVTNDNREEYVTLYVDWLLNDAISDQFNAFSSGFDTVVRESPIKHLFRYDELELLIRGSEKYNFNELEEGTEYDGGFNKVSQTVKDFWSVVHEMSEEDRKRLLQFSTGSDRAPVGGLSKLRMVIARNGPDSSRLPTSHTCFNVILLPDYRNREKLKERLLKAISYSKGFGML